METIVELHAAYVTGPLRDGLEMDMTRLGLFNSIGAATRWLRRAIPQEAEYLKPEPGEPETRIHHASAAVITISPYPSDIVEVIYDETGRVRGKIDHSADPWAGRDPKTCKYALGDMLGYVSCSKYRIGIVYGLPPHVQGLKRGLDSTDNRYTLAFDNDGDKWAHQHIAEPLLWKIEHPVPRALQRTLRKLYEQRMET